MANTPTALSQIQANLKPVFGEAQIYIPDEDILQKLVPFKAANSVGRYFMEPVEVRPGWSITYLGESDTNLDLQEAQPFVTQEARVTPSFIVHRVQLSAMTLNRAPDNADNQKAFVGTAGLAVSSMARQLRRAIEVGMLCGQDGIGEVESADDNAETITIKQSSFRPGLTAILEGAGLTVLQSGTLDSSPTNRAVSLTVSAVDIDNRKLTFSGTPNLLTVAAGDILFLSGSAGGPGASSISFTDQVGLRKQVRLQTGTLFNIAKQTYSQTRGNVLSVDGPVDAGTVQRAVTKAVNRGFQGEALAIVAPRAWAVLNTQLTAMQVFNQQGPSVNAKAELGTDELYLRFQGVRVHIVAHPYQAEGEMLILPKEYMKRIGSSYKAIGGLPSAKGSEAAAGADISFGKSGMNEMFFEYVPGKAAYEMQVQTDQQVYLQRCPWAVHVIGLQY